MNYFNYRQQNLYVENVSIADIAREYGTPCYIYSKATLERDWYAFADALAGTDHLICYAVKANANLAILNVLARLGSGFDIVSQGELERVLAAGAVPEKIVYSGVGKTVSELQRALEVGICCFNIESESELQRLQEVALALDKRAPIAIRINPDVDAKTHPYIATGLRENKFGINIPQAINLYQAAQKLSHIDIHGIDCHIGSQLTELAPFQAAFTRVLAVVIQLEQLGITLQHINIGGGLGIRYHNETLPTPAEYVQAAKNCFRGRKEKLILEPGRAIVANAGILVTEIQYLKSTEIKNFAIVDAGMNDLLRPALYRIYQDVIPVRQHEDMISQVYDIVGPVCESSDFLANDRKLALQRGDLLAICHVGAYGFVMSSNYNSRVRAIEIMVDDDNVHVIRSRETYNELFSRETILPI